MRSAGRGSSCSIQKTAQSQEGEIEDRPCGWEVAELGLERRAVCAQNVTRGLHSAELGQKRVAFQRVSLSQLGHEQL